MKKSIRSALSLLLILAFAISMSGFSVIPVKSIKLNAYNLTLQVGKTYSLKAVFTPSNTTQKFVNFISVNKSVASVSTTGKITALKPGKTVINVISKSNNKVTAKCNVAVTQVDIFSKYPKTIIVKTARHTDGTHIFEPGNPDADSFDKNIWMRAYEEELGIKLKYDWIAPVDQLENKWNVTIASGDLPDIMPVRQKNFKMLAEAGMIEDMGKYVDKYASPTLKDMMITDGGYAKRASTINGKLMAVPQPGVQPDNASLIMIRVDWLKKLGLSEPKSIDDVVKIAEAFTKKDPDGNGKDDTLGMAVSKELSHGISDLTGFFNGYHAYFNTWIKDSNGGIMYGSIQPEFKPALLRLQDMYKKGLIDREFAVKDFTKAAEPIAAGKIGMTYGVFWAPNMKIIDNIRIDANAEWKALPIVSVDNKVALSQSSINYDTFVFLCVKKGFRYPEAAVKITNIFAEKLSNPKSQEEYVKYGELFTKDGAKINLAKYALTNPVYAWKNMTAHLLIDKALKTGDTSKMMPNQLQTLDDVKSAMNGDRTKMGNLLIFGPTGTFSIVSKYKNENTLLTNEFLTFNTPTMLEKGKALFDKSVEVFTKIILGAPISEFDQFVTDWKKLGGDKMTEEVNAWYKTTKK